MDIEGIGCIIDKRPAWIVRYGMTLLTVVIASLCYVLDFIPYRMQHAESFQHVDFSGWPVLEIPVSITFDEIDTARNVIIMDNGDDSFLCEGEIEAFNELSATLVVRVDPMEELYRKKMQNSGMVVIPIKEKSLRKLIFGF